MDGIEEFLLLRYSLVEERQDVFDVFKLPTPKGEAVFAALDEDREFAVNGVVYGFVGFARAQPTSHHSFPRDRFVVGKVAKLRQVHMGKKVPGNIVETSEDDWQPVLAIFDLQRQYILIEKDWKFGTPEQTIRALQGGLRYPILAKYNHSIFVEGCVRKEHFWKIIETHRKVYKLELKLISPNILETNLRARDALEALKNLFGQDQVKIGLANDQGELQVPKNPVGDYLEYIEEGEGAWSVTTEGDHGGKKTHSSSENIELITISRPDHDVTSNRHDEGGANVDAGIVNQAFDELEKYREQ